MQGKLYGLGVGPGDPELLTIKALRLIRENEVIAVPGNDIKASVAYQIVKGVYDELDAKTLIPVAMPMTKDKALLNENYDRAAEKIADQLDQGKNVVFLTLGDPTVYSTYMYVHQRLEEKGYRVEIISGITSFCAVAARMNMSLVERSEPLHVIPASYQIEEALKLPGTKVLMKAGKQMKYVKEQVKGFGKNAVMIENCGMPDEKIYASADEIPENAGYYSLIVIKEEHNL